MTSRLPVDTTDDEPFVVVDDDQAEPLYDGRHVAGVWWDIHAENVHDPDEAADLARDLLDRQTLPDGGAGALSTWWGPPLREIAFTAGALRVDFHRPRGLARVVWEQTGELGVQSGVAASTEPLPVMESSARTPAYIPAGQALVGIEAAIAAIGEYVATRQRPTILTWQPGPDAVRSAA